jgi:hypothetical protein
MSSKDDSTNSPARQDAQDAAALKTKFYRERSAWLNQIVADPGLPASAFKVAYVIGEHLNRTTGEAWPSILTIAKGAAMASGGVSTMVRRLEARGYLAVEKGRPCRYRMNANVQPAETRNVQPAEIRDVQPAETRSQTFSPLNDSFSPLNYDVQPAEPNLKKEPKEEPKERGERAPPLPGFEQAEAIGEQKQPKSKTAPFDEKSFIEFWKAYPRKVARFAAEAAFAGALERATPAALIAGAVRYAAERAAAIAAGDEPRWTRHAATWLNKGCWLDEAAAAAGGGKTIDQEGNVVAFAAPPQQQRQRPRTAREISEELLAWHRANRGGSDG